MLSSKKRAKIRSIVHEIKPNVMIGKDGITENIIEEIDNILLNKEIAKIKLLNNFDEDIKDVVESLSNKTDSYVISVMGNVIILYRYSEKEGVKHIV